MSRVSEQWSRAKSSSQGRPDANLANDANNLGGIAAEEYATKKYVQDYHNGKEENLKQYVDSQDASVLEQAKEYTNSQIRNQDFSNFAEISDLQVLNNNLTSQIEQGLNAQKQYTDQKTQAIVDDVNANFQDVNGAISTLNGNVNNLFQSVSNGKSLIAGAITDKGVPTSASDSYSTMAGNIRAIPSGGGSGTDPNYVNTSDGTATAEDIKVGKAAYVKGQKIYGTLIAQAEEGLPTYGTDTSNATATAADIVWGKTAYARGQLITGTLLNNDVEEIYGLNTDNIEVKPFTSNTKDITGEIDIKTYLIAFSKDMNYCVRCVSENNSSTPKYIESFQVTEDGFAYNASTSMGGEVSYKKYRYTLSELGIEEDEEIMSIAFGAPFETNKCYLYFLTRKNVADTSIKKVTCKLYVKEYHLNDNGVIGKEYNNQNVVDLEKEVYTKNLTAFSNSQIVTFNNSANSFLILEGSNQQSFSMNTNIYKGNILSNQINIENSYSFTVPARNSFGGRNNYKISQNDRYVYPFEGNHGTTYAYSIIAFLDNNGNVEELKSVSNYGLTYIPEIDTFIGATGNPENACEFKFNENYEKNEIKKFTLNSSGYTPKIIPINNKIISIIENSNKNYETIYVYNKALEEIQDGEEIIYSKSFIGGGEKDTGNSSVNRRMTFISDNFSKIYSTLNHNMRTSSCQSTFKQILLSNDTQNIIGVKYKNKSFYAPKGQLTAIATDVATGKTFIGQNGTVETGTMEVTENE